jgi:sugar fermentation stimulation protein A
LDFEKPLKTGCFLARLNRFLGLVEVGGESLGCFIPNPGRLRDLLKAGAKVYLSERISENRKTRYDLILVELDETLVSIDSRIPNRIIGEAVDSGLIPEFKGLRIEEREPFIQGSRLDFLLQGDAQHLLLEVKSCTLVEEGVALFPDAPTSRGERHMKVLSNALGIGRAAALFLVQRDDASVFRPNWEVDPSFSDALRTAVERGVEAYAYTTRVSPSSIELHRRLPIELEPHA